MAELSEIFEYRDGMIFRKKKTAQRTQVGERAGYAHCDGYRQVSVNGKAKLEHRIIWEMHNGQIPDGYQVDHINHVRNDNRIENLRLVSHKENCRNMSLSPRNTSGFNGVQYNQMISKWLARIVFEGKVITIGYFEDFDEACAARKRKQDELGFHANHGLGQ